MVVTGSAVVAGVSMLGTGIGCGVKLVGPEYGGEADTGEGIGATEGLKSGGKADADGEIEVGGGPKCGVEADTGSEIGVVERIEEISSEAELTSRVDARCIAVTSRWDVGDEAAILVAGQRTSEPERPSEDKEGPASLESTAMELPSTGIARVRPRSARFIL